MGYMRVIARDLVAFWKSLTIILVPLVLLPLPIIYYEYSEARCGYIVLIMAVFWMTEVVPLAITAFLPIFLFPLLNVLSVKETCQTYLKDTNFLFFGGLMVAVAVEESNLHRRIALKVLLKMGARPEWLMFGFMIVTAFLSMWMSNTATTAMMVPICVAVIKELQQDAANNDQPQVDLEMNAIDKCSTPATSITTISDTVSSVPNGNNSVSVQSIPTKTEKSSKPDLNVPQDRKIEPTGIAKGILLGICYAANIGGTGTLTGTGPNLILRGQLDVTYPNADTGITFASWMPFAIPPLILLLVLGWILLQLAFFGRENMFLRCFLNRKQNSKSTKNDSNDRIKKMLLMKYEQMGRMSFAEKSVLFWFLILVVLWIFREPRFMPGWQQLLGLKNGMISDASSAMLIGCILFAWPRQMPDFICCSERDSLKKAVPRKSILTWDAMSVKFPWSVIMLLGGGFAVAEGVKSSQLSTWIGCNLRLGLSSLDSFSMLAVFTILITFITEVSSNTATASIFIPIMISLAENLKENPLMFCLPATLSPSFAFMLPVATPPNAIVYSTGVIKIREMMLVGFFMNWICICVMLLNMKTYAKLLFPIDVYPDWASSNSSSCL